MARSRAGVLRSEVGVVSSSVAEEATARSGDFVDIDQALAIIRRRWKVVAACAVLGLMLGAAYILVAVPRYTATANLLIDQSNSKLVDQLSAVGGVLSDDASVLSQVEILRSEKVLLAVIDRMKLTQDRAFNSTGGSILGWLRSSIGSFFSTLRWFASSELQDDRVGHDASRRRALETLLSNLTVRRVDRSYVLLIAYSSVSPELATRIVDAIAEEYLNDQLDSKYDATRRASEWLQRRIDELRVRSVETDLAVQRFRAQNGLLAADGKLISDQQLTELNSQLITARVDTAKANARYGRIKEIIDNRSIDAIVTDVLDSSVINQLRSKYLDASRREADLSSRLGASHIQAVRLRSEMQEYRRLMFEELGRIAESYQSEVEVAKAREDTLEASVRSATGVSTAANETQVQLRELERESDTYRNLYQSFMQRYQEAVQQQSFPITEARIIARASASDRPTSPKKGLSLVVAILLGAGIGAGIGAYREFRDRFFRTGDQIRDTLNLEFLGHALALPNEATRQVTLAAAEADPRTVAKRSKATDYAIDHPMSSFAETLRSIKIAVDLTLKDKKSKVIGVTSVLPGEGKSTISMNLAELIASQGAQTVVVDCDLRNPGLTRTNARHGKSGLIEVLLSEVSFDQATMWSPRTQLALLPAVIGRKIPHTAEMMASQAFRKLLDELRERFDYVILDLPPILPVVDVRAIVPQVDGIVLVVEWGKTSRSVVRSCIETSPALASKCVGVVLNKVNEDRLKLYRGFGTTEYYASRYASYYNS